MDSGTHVVCGAAVGLISANILKIPYEWTIYFVCILSSIIPDFDIIFKLKSNNSYVLNHRGLSHTIISLPFLALIAPLIVLAFFQNFGVLYLLSIICIVIHLLLDILNPYGTTVIPRGKDYHLNVMYTFDPIFFSILLTCFIISIFYIYAFFVGCFLLVCYFVFRLIRQKRIKKKMKDKYPKALNIYVLSKMSPSRWHVIIEEDGCYYVGVYKKDLEDIDHFYKTEIPYQNILEKNKTYMAFIRKSYCYICISNNTEISLIDLKYRKKGFYFFRAIFRIENDKITNSYLGWIFSDNKFQKKLSRGEIK